MNVGTREIGRSKCVFERSEVTDGETVGEFEWEFRITREKV
jgi:hypothetical protein